MSSLAGIAAAAVATAAEPSNAITVTLDDRTQYLLESVADGSLLESPIFNTLVGACLAVLVGWVADLLREKRERREKDREEKEFERNTAVAIRREIEALSELYASGIGAQLKECKSDFFHLQLAITEDWFTVFSANASQMGRLGPKISCQIITVYSLVKSLIEEFKLNNRYLLDYVAATDTLTRTAPHIGDPHAVVENTLARDRKDRVAQRLKEQLQRIRDADIKLAAATKELYSMFDTAGYR